VTAATGHEICAIGPRVGGEAQAFIFVANEHAVKDFSTDTPDHRAGDPHRLRGPLRLRRTRRASSGASRHQGCLP